MLFEETRIKSFNDLVAHENTVKTVTVGKCILHEDYVIFVIYVYEFLLNNSLTEEDSLIPSNSQSHVCWHQNPHSHAIY